jgi:S1-C subfamily serine protease
VTYIPLTPASARSHDAPVTTGALVVTITPNSPAAKAGIQEGDIIKAVSGQTINDSTSLMDAIRDKKPNDRVQVTLLRDGNEQTVEVALGRSPGSRTNRTPFDRLRSGFTKILARQ